jgi:ABC-2 type transport system permease protein
MAAVGATTFSYEAQHVGIVYHSIWLLFILIAVFMQTSTASVLYCFFPHSPHEHALRIGFSIIPAWQMITSIIILVLSAWGAIWLAGRAFRLGMLRYGQRLRLKELFSSQRV